MKTKGHPSVSIGVPVYNGQNYLAEALDSLLAQTFGDLEIVISDNASTDRTEEICREYAARDSRVRYYRQAENRGAGWNFSEVFRLSRGEYFKWAAHDDLCAPTLVERCVERLEADRGLVLCSARAAVVDADGQVVRGNDARGGRAADFQGVSAAMEARRLRRTGSARSSQRYLGVLIDSLRCYEIFGLIHSSAMRRTGLHRPYNGAEKVFLAELALLGRFAELDETLFYSRWHRERFSANVSAAAQARHMDPAAARRFVWPRQVRSSWGYLSLIPKADLSPLEKARCLLAFGRYLSQASKWKRALCEAALGRATAVDLPESRRTEF
ncbi:MAG TPA: glycosyltransferase family 2 protein, partial [Pirellulales bacterium]|nr:glycosyltransferase family 2 protein [Pirellulales bacterium]